MNIVALIQPSELGNDFRFENGKWHVNFPTTENPPPPISLDANNIVKNIVDGMFIDKRDRSAYALVQDTVAQKIRLYGFAADTVFNIDTATLASEIDMLAMNGTFDDVAIDEGVITFTDADSGLTLTLNTNELQRVGNIISSSTVAVVETAGILTLNVKLDSNPNNLLEATPQGLQVTEAKIANVFNSELAKANIHTQEMSVIPEGVGHSIGDQIITIPKVQLVNSIGTILGMVNDPTAFEQSQAIIYPFKVTFNNNLEGVGPQAAHFNMIVDGVQYFDNTQDFAYVNMNSIPGVSLIAIFNSGNISIMASYIGNQNPIHVTMVPTAEQKAYTNAFVGAFPGAKVLPNGNLEFILVPEQPT